MRTLNLALLAVKTFFIGYKFKSTYWYLLPNKVLFQSYNLIVLCWDSGHLCEQTRQRWLRLEFFLQLSCQQNRISRNLYQENILKKKSSQIMLWINQKRFSRSVQLIGSILFIRYILNRFGVNNSDTKSILEQENFARTILNYFYRSKINII